MKALKHAKNIFFNQKLHFFTQISDHSTCMHLHHSGLDSGGQIYLKMTKKLSAYAKTTCWWNSSRLELEFVGSTAVLHARTLFARGNLSQEYLAVGLLSKGKHKQ